MSDIITEVIYYFLNAMVFSLMIIGLSIALKPKWKYKWLPLVSYLLFYSALYPFTYSGNAFVSTAMTLGMVVTAIIFYRGSIGERVLLSCIFLISLMLIDYLIDALFSIMKLPIKTRQEQLPAAMIILALYIFVVVLTVKLWNKFRKNNMHADTSLFAIFPLTQVLSFLVISYLVWFLKYGIKKDVYITAMWIVLFVIAALYVISDVLLLRAFRQNALNIQLKEQIKLLESKNAWEIEYNNIILNKETEIAKLRHDFLNVIQIIKLETADAPHSRSDKVLEELEEELEKSRPHKLCANNFINLILSEKMNAASEKGIAFECEINLGEYESISNLDLSRIFINITNNALEAAEAAHGDRRFIRICAAEIKGYIVIKSVNTHNGTLYKQGNTYKTKKQYGTHGLGLSIISSIAEKYEGELLIDHTDSEFTITVTLKI